MLAGNWKTSRMVAHFSTGGEPPNAALWRGTSEEGASIFSQSTLFFKYSIFRRHRRSS